MDKRINIASTLSALVYGDITKSGIEILGLKIVKVFDCKGTYGAIILSEVDKIYYIVFRGTEDFDELLDNFEVFQKKAFIDHKECKIHEGFLKAYNLVKDEINQTQFGTFHIVICGHSLGGALATICSADLLCLNPRTVITFGSPRVGDKEFVSIFQSEVKESLRFVHDNDIVPMVPNIGYRHVYGEIRLDDNGKQIGKYNFWRSFWRWLKGKGGFLSIKDHFMINYQKSVGAWNKDY